MDEHSFSLYPEKPPEDLSDQLDWLRKSIEAVCLTFERSTGLAVASMEIEKRTVVRFVDGSTMGTADVQTAYAVGVTVYPAVHGCHSWPTQFVVSPTRRNKNG